MKANSLAMMADLRRWYPEYYASLPPLARRSFTRIQHITPSQLGNASDNTSNGFISFKAQETRWLQPFVLHLLRKHKARFIQYHGATVDWAALEAAGQALIDLMDIMGREPRKMSEDGLVQLRETMDVHIRNAVRGGVHMLPKHHMESLNLFWDL